MDAWETVRANVFSPVVLAFVLGAVAVAARSDLELPEAAVAALSIYLLLSIGLRGGVELSHADWGAFWRPALATLLLGVLVPVWSYAILRGAGRLGVADAAAVAAHYGSVSVVTFAAALAFLDARGVAYEGFLNTLVALLEVPAIVVALLIARVKLGGNGGGWGETLRELLAGKSVLLLAGGLVIGLVSGERGYARVAPLFTDLFGGALLLFLLEMGVVAARRGRDVARAGPFLVAFAVVMPLLHGTVGAWLGTVAGLSVGGSTVFAVLAASSSYIAAPAAVRVALPQANPGYYLTMSLGITFPFNLVVGVPLYHEFARRFAGGG